MTDARAKARSNSAEFTVPGGRRLNFNMSIGAGTRLSQRLNLEGRDGAGHPVLHWSSGERFAPDGHTWSYSIPAYPNSYTVTASGFCKIYDADWQPDVTDADHTQVTPAGGYVYFDDVGDHGSGHDWNFRDLMLDFSFGARLRDDAIAGHTQLPVEDVTIPSFALPAIQIVTENVLRRDGTAIIVFFDARGTEFCMKRLQAFQRILSELKAKGLQVYGISTDEGLAKTAEWAREIGVEFPLMADAGGLVSEQFGLRSRNGRSERALAIVENGAIIHREIVDDTDVPRSVLDLLASSS